MPRIAPQDIETRSMEIIDGLLPADDWTPGECDRGEAAGAYLRRSHAGRMSCASTPRQLQPA